MIVLVVRTLLERGFGKPKEYDPKSEQPERPKFDPPNSIRFEPP